MPPPNIEHKHEHAQTKDGKLKAKYRDLPRYPVILEYEAEFKNSFNKNLASMATHITRKMVEFLKENKKKDVRIK